MNGITVDMIVNGKIQGDVAGLMQANGRIDLGVKRPFIGSDGRSYVTVYRGGDPKKKESWYTYAVNAGATLRRDEWKQLDTAVMEPSRYRLGGMQDLIENGLVFNLGNAMGTTVLEWHDVNEAMEATMTMDAVTRGNNDRPVYQYNYLPIPIIHADFEIHARELAASRNMGNPLDTTVAERASRRILEFQEKMLFTDTTFSYGAQDERSRNTIYSYLNFPDRLSVNLSIPWDNSACTGKMIVQDVREMKQASIEAYHYGPWMLYIPTKYETIIDDDYVGSNPDTAPNTTIRDRLMKISGIKGIKVVDTLPDDNVLLVQMTPDVVRLVRGMDIQTIEWATEGGMISKYKVMTIQVPQIRSDANGRTGIVHLA